MDKYNDTEMCREFSTADPRQDNRKIDTTLAVLTDEQRRQVLRYFQGADDPVASVETLMDDLVESGRPADVRERTAIKLHHVTLPRLANAGFIEYDARSHTIRYRASPRWEQISDLLTQLERSP